MKKIAIATMLAAASLASVAQVTIYGKLRAFEESVTVGSASAVAALTNDASRLGLKGSETLGGGLTANFTIETGVGADAPTATTLGDRTSVVGVSSKMWSVGVGRDKHTIARTLDNYDAMGNAYGSSAAVIHAAQGSRLSNAVFASVTPINGLSANYVISNSEAAGVNNAQAISIEFSSGPISATVANFDNGSTSTSTIYGAKVNVANTGTMVFATYSDDKVANVTSSGKSIGVNLPLTSSLMALASYGTNDTTKAFDLGASYSLSKRTMVHARYLKEDAAVTTTKYALGLEHNF